MLQRKMGKIKLVKVWGLKVAKLKTLNLKPKQKKKMKLLIITAIRAFDKDIKKC
jgi:ribosomal protein L23